jgi:hypothetical protein
MYWPFSPSLAWSTLIRLLDATRSLEIGIGYDMLESLLYCQWAQLREWQLPLLHQIEKLPIIRENWSVPWLHSSPDGRAARIVSSF